MYYRYRCFQAGDRKREERKCATILVIFLEEFGALNANTLSFK